MQLELNIEKSKPMIKKKVNLEFIQLTQRDLEIISFVCDMKFASLDDIYEKYFKKLKDGTLSKSTWWARQRLNELFKHKYLNRIYSFSERKAYYLGTLKGYLEIVKKCPFSLPTRPIENINFNTFDHDRLLLSIRLDMEKKNEITNWISDRTLAQFPEHCPSIDKTYLPDAIYTTPNGEKVAFELEISRKAKKRYEDKIQSYVNCIREHKDNLNLFKKVVFYVTNESVKELLCNEVRIFKQFFTIKFHNHTVMI